MSDQTNFDVCYDLKSAKLPYLAGRMLNVFVRLVESPLKNLLIPSLLKSAGVGWFRKQHVSESPRMLPIHSGQSAIDNTAKFEFKDLPKINRVTASPGFRYVSISDYANAYERGVKNPENVVTGILDLIDSDKLLNAFIAVNRDDVLKQARESTKRIQNGQALSILDGVPVAVKDEVDMIPYPTTGGTAFLGREVAKSDSTVVARLRSAGAVLIGKTNMHEIGIGVTGLNPIHGTPRNPYNTNRHSGGSSSGSGVAVSAGLCPLAVGADGGGSIRIPASFCGVVGLKPTFGRVSEHGALDLCWSLAHLGPIGASVADVAIGYAHMSGYDDKDPLTGYQPAPQLTAWNKDDIRGLKIGIFRPWFRHASESVVDSCESMLSTIEESGGKIIDISIPDLELARVAHTITIAGEMAQSLGHTYADHHKEHSADVRINLALARALSSLDYIKAQRTRHRMINHLNDVFKSVDVIVTPTTGITAPGINSKALKYGESDLTTLFEIMRFAPLANLTGLPAISFPVGYDPDGLPVGMQAIAPAWQEAILLQLAYFVEGKVERKKPDVFFRQIET